MNWRRSVAVSALTLTSLSLGLVGAGCGHSEEEWQQKIREVSGLNEKLKAEQNAHKKTTDDLNEAQAEVAQLKSQLKKAGVDLSTLNNDLSEQRAAMEKLRRDKEQLDEIRKRMETLRAKLQALTKMGVEVVPRKNRLVIRLPGDVLFDSGKTELKKDGKEILSKIADTIRGDSQLSARSYQVAGHTDNKGFNGGPYKDNWGLSVMRARDVLTFLVGPTTDPKNPGGGLPADHWSASGYGETDPIVANDTPENMQKNRRVELVVLPNVDEMLSLESLTK